MTHMLTDAFCDGSTGIDIKYRIDGEVFNLRRLQAKTKVKTYNIRDLLFADDCALSAGSEVELQNLMNKFSTACSNFDLMINTEKTEVMYQPAHGNVYKEPMIMINGTKLKAAHRFTYLGSTLSQNINIDDEVNSRISMASSSFGRLYANVWHRSGINLQTKLNVYRAAVLPVLLYASETWTIYTRHAKKLNHFHTNCLRKLLKIKRQDKIPDTTVLDRAGIPSINTILMKHQLRWAGHLVRMPDHRMPKILFYSEMSSGKRSRGGQKKRFKDTLKSSLKSFEIKIDSWEKAARDRTSWRSLLRKGAKSCEAARQAASVLRRQKRKASAHESQTVATISCPHCPRLFKARIGLTSHLRVH
uniref:C2H2-type domain-containing protein n=2 Tax=Arion vulgaris TaxID=1028688 RepID=A0A0B7BSD9_9EUPU